MNPGKGVESYYYIVVVIDDEVRIPERELKALQ